jgi:hypothetical protein
VELTIGSKSLTTSFFVVEVQDNYSVIFGRDWIHINRCVASTLHQFLIQWINNEINVVHADAMADWQHGIAQCLSRKDLAGYDFLSVSKDDFIHVSVKPASKARLSNVVFQ